MKAAKFLWQAAGCPMPTETNGTPIQTRDMSGAACASCGEPAAYRLEQAISDSFTTVKNASRAWPFGGKAVCPACVWCCRSLSLRCGLFFARLADAHGAGGYWFVSMRPIPGHPETRPDPLSALLAPPPAPFVACLPLYGIDHGGEANAHRVVWLRTDGTLSIPPNPLVKLQSKHTALYSVISTSAERYRLQVDDIGDVTVDVPLWRSLRAICDELLAEFRADGVGAVEARAALTTLRPPLGIAVSSATWQACVAPLWPHVGAAWWPLFTSLLLMPDLMKKGP